MNLRENPVARFVVQATLFVGYWSFVLLAWSPCAARYGLHSIPSYLVLAGLALFSWPTFTHERVKEWGGRWLDRDATAPVALGMLVVVLVLVKIAQDFSTR